MAAEAVVSAFENAVADAMVDVLDDGRRDVGKVTKEADVVW